jgi:hypothetical protein
VLSNEGSYWRPPGHGRPTNADAFRLHEGLVLSGARLWGPHAGAGTMGKTRQSSIQLAGTYSLAWRAYTRPIAPHCAKETVPLAGEGHADPLLPSRTGVHPVRRMCRV